VTSGGEKPLEELQVPPISTPAPAPSIINQIFIVHGKDTTPLEQLKKILSEFKIPFKVAVDEPNVGRPISQKVSDLMKSCTSAIVIFTADEEYADAQGNKIFRPSDNTVYELGAASILYGDKIVILKEEGVCLASDFSDLGHIIFKKDEMDAKSMQIIKELIGFGLLKFTTA
jgi:predicted nucleotide-binding protein